MPFITLISLIIRQILRKYLLMERDQSAIDRYRAHREQEKQERARKLNLVKELIYHIAVNGKTDPSKWPPADQTLSAEDQYLRQAFFDAAHRQRIFPVGRIHQAGIEIAFTTVGASPEERREIYSQALRQAKGYWNDHLADPTLAPEEKEFGRARIAKISAQQRELESTNASHYKRGEPYKRNP